MEGKRKTIRPKLKSKYWKRPHKSVINIMESVKEAYAFDEENGNKLWTEGINEEMSKVRIAVKEYNVPPDKLISYQEIGLHMIFYIKLGENFQRRARMLAGIHTKKTSSLITYSSAVSRYLVIIMLMVSALNDLDLQEADIENAYLTAPCRENIWTVAGPEFGINEVKIFIVVGAFYGLKSSGVIFRAFLAEILYETGFKSSAADPDVWYRDAMKSDCE